MYIERTLRQLFHKARTQFPAVLITGPRQSGKTTFLQETLSDEYRYVNFDDTLNREFASQDPKGFLAQFEDERVVLDEIQYAAGLLPYIKMEIDSDRRNPGRWILTGSQQFNMMKNASESLAGRIAILNLLPFYFKEHGRFLDASPSTLIWQGSYPEVILDPEVRDLWISSYITTYLERDVRQIQRVHDLELFQTFFSICASRHTQELSYATLSKQVGVSQPTIKEWISVLVASGIAIRLRPFHTNFGKRLIKSSKMYFLDSLIPAYLTRQPSAEALFNGSMGGSFFEGFIVAETYKTLMAYKNNTDMYFWRSHDQVEIDLLIELNGSLYPVEIKKTATPAIQHGESIRRFTSFLEATQDTSLPVGEGFVVCTVREEAPLGPRIRAVPWKRFLEWLTAEASQAAT
jgi:uncharacterized protein